MSIVTADEFYRESRDGVLIDVRSPVEFAAGHIPQAVNVPLFSDDERAAVGTLYADRGRDEALEKGLEFVGPKMALFVREAKRLVADRAKVSGVEPDANKAKKSVWVHCWRGGMRSQSFAWLLETAGFTVHVLEGGYKAFRKIAQRKIARRHPLIVLSGLTGAGKTEYLKMLRAAGEQVIDLEGLANHRGSSFGAIGLGDQPSTEQFENRLFEALQQLDPQRRIWVEDEGSRLGQVVVPARFVKQVRRAAVVFLDVDKERRLDNLMQEYGELDREHLKHATLGIRKRLGGQNVNDAIAAIESGDLRAAADISLAYYDRSYLKAFSEMPREQSINLATHGLTDDEVVAQLIASDVGGSVVVAD